MVPMDTKRQEVRLISWNCSSICLSQVCVLRAGTTSHSSIPYTLSSPVRKLKRDRSGTTVKVWQLCTVCKGVGDVFRLLGDEVKETRQAGASLWRVAGPCSACMLICRQSCGPTHLNVVWTLLAFWDPAMMHSQQVWPFAVGVFLPLLRSQLHREKCPGHVLFSASHT